MQLVVAHIAAGDVPHAGILEVSLTILKQKWLTIRNFSSTRSARLYFATQNFLVCVNIFDMIFTKVYDFARIISSVKWKTDEQVL